MSKLLYLLLLAAHALQLDQMSSEDLMASGRADVSETEYKNFLLKQEAETEKEISEGNNESAMKLV